MNRDNNTLRPDVIAAVVRQVTLEVFSSMLGVDAVAGDVFIEGCSSDGNEGVLSFIGLAGNCVGAGSLRCSSETACRLASAFLMSEFESIDGEVLDAIGELANMIIGNLKTHLEDRLGQISLSLPTVIHGRSYTARTSSHEEWTVVPFRWSGGHLDVKICLKHLSEGKTHANVGPEFVCAGMRRG